MTVLHLADSVLRCGIVHLAAALGRERLSAGGSGGYSLLGVFLSAYMLRALARMALNGLWFQFCWCVCGVVVLFGAVLARISRKSQRSIEERPIL